MKTRIFLSYARDDDERFVWRLYEGLKSAGLEDLWFDQVSMPSRQLTFLQEIRDAVNDCDRLILVIGPNAVTSDYVTQEWRFAYFNAIRCVNPVVRLDGLDSAGKKIDAYSLIPEDLRLFHAEDFRDDTQFDAHLANLIRQINDPVPPVGKLVAVPDLPPHYLDQPNRLAALRDILLVDLQKPIVVSGASARVGLQGMGGIGKSVLASALAHRPEVRRAFPDGIYWVTLGQEPNIAYLQRGLARALGDDALFTEVAAGKEKLAELLIGRTALLVLDDVWQRGHAEAFNVAGPRGRLLLTTRDAGLVTALAAKENHYQVQLPTKTEAEALLSKVAAVPLEALPTEAREVVNECGRLPLGLALCGGMVYGGRTWRDVLEALREHDLEYLSDSHPAEEHHRNIWKAMNASVRSLPSAEQERFAELAVFGLDTGAPEAAVEMFWGYTAGLTPRRARDLLTSFRQRSLVDFDQPTRRVSLHDLLHNFAAGIAAKRFGPLVGLHQRLLDAYRKVCPNGWQTGPNDGYFFERLVYHLKLAGTEGELRSLLLNFYWLQAKLHSTNPVALISDFDHLPNDKDAQLMKAAVRLSADVLARDKQQLRTQLYGRLMGHTSTAMQGFLNSLLHGACWLRLLTPSLEQAGGPLLFSLRGHTRGVLTVALNANGTIAVSGSEDGSLRVWNTNTGDEVYRLSGHAGRVNGVAVTKDGSHAISVSDDHTVKVWDLSKGEELRTLKGHSGVVRAVAVTGDSKRIISISTSATAETRELKLWDLVSGKELHTLTGEEDEMTVILIADNGKTAIYPLENKIVDLQTGGQLKAVMQFAVDLISTVISSDGRRVIISSDRTLKAWDEVQIDDWSILEFLRHAKKALTGLTDEVNAVSVLIGETRGLCGVGDTILTVWDLSSERKLYLRGHAAPINAVAVTADGMRALSASSDGTLKFWDLNSGEELLAFEGHTGAVHDVAITPSGTMAVSASYDKTVRVWNVSSVKKRHLPKRHMGRINHLVITSDDKYVISASADSMLKIWDIGSGEEIRTLKGHFKSVNAVAISVRGERAISASDDYTLRVWDLESGQLTCTISPGQSWLWDVAMSPDGTIALSNSATLDVYTLKVWDLDTGKELYILEGHSDTVFSVAIFAGGSRAISASADKTLKVWDLSCGRELCTLIGHSAAVFDVAVSKDGSRAISISTDEILKVWDLSSGELLFTLGDEPLAGNRSVGLLEHFDYFLDNWPGRQMLLEGCAEGGGTLALTADCSMVAYASKRNTLNTWNLLSMERHILTGHSDQIRWITLTSDDSRIVSASKDRTVRVWDLKTRNQIATFLGDSEIRTCAITSDGLTVIAGEDSGLIHFLRLVS
jgi:WD40 repeat protein